jgi:hypothetical protein
VTLSDSCRAGGLHGSQRQDAAWVWTIHLGTITVPDPELAGTKKEQGDLKTDNAVQRDV